MTRTPTLTVTSTPGACTELLVNGGFETNTAWVFPGTAYPAGYTTARARSGSRSLRAGVDVPPDRYAYSDAYQTVAIPANAATVTLRAWWLPRSAEGNLAAAAPAHPELVEGPSGHVEGPPASASSAIAPTHPELVEGPAASTGSASGERLPPTALLQALADGTLPQGLLAGDRQYLLLLNTSGTILAVPLWTRSDAATWSPLTFDLTAYRGQTIQVRFGVYNDGNGQSTAFYLDDASLAACPSPVGQARRDAFRVWMPLVWSGRP